MISAGAFNAIPTFWLATPGLFINLNHVISITVHPKGRGATLTLTTPLADGKTFLKIDEGEQLEQLLAVIAVRPNTG
jgi:hypothetical protein